MVFIKSCEKCKNDCENGMTCAGIPSKYCGGNTVSYFCPIHQGAYIISLETARNNYGFKGKAFEELDIINNYGKFQDIVERLSMVGVNKPFTTNEVCSKPDYIEFHINLPEYSVFQVSYMQQSYSNSGCSHRRIVGYCDTIKITVDNQMIGLIGSNEVFRLTDNHIDYGASEGVYNVAFKHLK